MNKNQNYDIIVIGGGHAGIEAASISAKLGNKVALITLDKDKIGFMHCNPRIGGGGGKGILVREIDALGGIMGLAADVTALQFKLLNTSSGPATQSLRVQSDKIAYSCYMQKILSKQKNLEIIEGIVWKLLISDNIVHGVELKGGKKFFSKAVILTTGTYLQPLTYRGKEVKSEGPNDEEKVVNNISQQLKELGFNFKRFKTGTCPRILKSSIDFSQTKLEPGSNLPLKFSHISKQEELLPFEEQLPCYLTYTNEKTRQIISKNLHLSPMISEKNLATGPRYCPSIEHKFFYFPNNEKHQVYLEPESRSLKTIYLQGLSTSLPIEIQAKFLKTIPALKKAKVEKWGYAIAYDVIDAIQLKKTLESKKIKNFYSAGQINGTSGYEEAAIQGLLAGINASRTIKNKKPLILGRDEALGGVIIDDLTTKKREEPLRLLSSSAEYRLLLRHDNAHTRLWPIAHKFGLLTKKNWEEFCQRKVLKKDINNKLKETIFFTDDLQFLKLFPDLNFSKKSSRRKTNAYELLKKNEVSLSKFLPYIPEIAKLNWDEIREIEVNNKYEGYIRKQIEEVRNFRKIEKKNLPENINYNDIKNLRPEARDRLKEIRPSSLGQAMRISGVNPTDVLILNFYLEKNSSLKLL